MRRCYCHKHDGASAKVMSTLAVPASPTVPRSRVPQRSEFSRVTFPCMLQKPSGVETAQKVQTARLGFGKHFTAGLEIGGSGESVEKQGRSNLKLSIDRSWRFGPVVGPQHRSVSEACMKM